MEVEEDLIRTFPVSAGWIVETDDESLTVGVSVGVPACYGLASAEVEETAEQVKVAMTAGFRSEATGSVLETRSRAPNRSAATGIPDGKRRGSCQVG